MYFDEIKKIQAVDFKKTSTLRLIQKAVAFCIVERQYGEARDMYVILKKLYQQAAHGLAPTARDMYESQIIRLVFFNINFVSDDDLFVLLNNQLVKTLKEGNPVLNQISEYVDYHHDYYFEFSLANKFLEAVRKNIEIVSSKAISQWLSEYALEVGVEVPRDGLKRITFLNKNAVSLSAPEHNALLGVIELFDWLSYPTPEDDTEANTGIRRNSVFASVIESAIKEKIKEPLLRTADFTSLWGEVSNHLASLSEYESAAEFYLTIPTPISLGLFLRIWLVEFEHIDNEIVMQIALKVANNLKKTGYTDYMNMIYFDPQDNRLHWTEY